MRLVKVVLAPVTAPELVAPDRCRVPLSQRPLFLPTFYTLRVSDDDPSWGARCLNGAGGLLDYSWSMLSELGQTGHLLTGFWGCCCFGEPCCCVSCPSCLPSFLPASREGVCLMAKACQACTTLHPVPTPSLDVSSCEVQGRTAGHGVPSAGLTASNTETRQTSLEALGA